MLSGRSKGLILGIVFLTVVGTLLGISELFAMATALAALVAISVVLARRGARNLKLSWSSQEFVRQNDAFEIAISVEGSSLANYARCTPELEAPEEFELIESVPEFHNDFRQTHHVRLKASKRGIYQAGPVAVKVEDFLGLASSRVGQNGLLEIVVWPSPVDPGVLAVSNHQLNPVGQFEIGQKAPEGSSIHGIRQWAPGEAARHIHWPSTARLGKLTVKEFQIEAAEDLVIYFDTRLKEQSPHHLQAFETACGVVSHLLHEGWSAGHKIQLNMEQAMVESGPGPGEDANRRLALRSLALCKPVDYAGDALLHLNPAASAWSSSVIVVTLCWDASVEKLASFRRNQDFSAAVLVLDPDMDEEPLVREPAGVPGGKPGAGQGSFNVYKLRTNVNT